MNIKDYGAGRDDALLRAYQLVKAEGIEALEAEIRMRNITGIHTTLMNKELDIQSEHVKHVLFQMIRIASISILHDRFGFGQERCQRFLKEYEKLAVYLDSGWVKWTDLIETIKDEMKLVIETDKLTGDTMGAAYAHPEPEDIYSEPDMVRDDMWQAMLKTLHFTEEPVTKTRYQICDSNKNPILEYEGWKNKIQMYDVLSGIEIARDLLGWK